MAKPWTKEEIEYLELRWGSVSVKTISHGLGRSINSVKNKAQRLGLSDPRIHYDGITCCQLAKELNISYTILKGWIRRYEFPAKRKLFTENNRTLVVSYKDFWNWAEANKQMIDFTRLEENALGPEPDWVKEKRAADIIKKTKIKKSHNKSWTEEEDNTLKDMLNAYCYTYPEIAERLKRSEGAVKRRIWQLGLKARPVRLNNHIKYTDEEVNLIVTLFDKGHCVEDIASRINKSALGVRGKLERLGYKFKNGVPVK